MADKNQLNLAEAEQLADQIRINIAFEQMVVAVLCGALSGGALTLLIGLVQSLLGGFSVSGFVATLLETFFVSVLVFLVGFGASVVFGAPLFSALENRKRRNVWPYLAGALGVAVIVLVLTVGGLPTTEDISLKALASIFIPALIVAIVFARGMQPHWRAAEKAEADAQGPVMFRIH